MMLLVIEDSSLYLGLKARNFSVQIKCLALKDGRLYDFGSELVFFFFV